MVSPVQPAQSSDQCMEKAEAARLERIARYKEERRRQLAVQYGRPQLHDPATTSASSSSSGGGITIRSTRASRLRTAATANDGGKTLSVVRDRKDAVNGFHTRLRPDSGKEVPEASDSPPSTTASTSCSPRPDRDKSAKRKSNLNRSINAEPVPHPAEDVARRRRSLASSSQTQSPTKATRSSAESESSPRGRGAKRITPPRDTPRPRPHSSSCLLERQSSASPSLPEAPSLPDVVVLSPRPSSILKKKSLDETPTTASPTAGKPVSILKRKTSQEEGTAAPPVTFSPSVVEGEGVRAGRRQGILKKHRSLDDSARSDSPLRRSSLEETRRRTRTLSPEPQSILKRRTSRQESVELSAYMEPQGILKRKTSGGAVGPVHVTIADSVILAVAGEDSLTDETVKPILKKKTSVCEDPPDEVSEPPRPILKKKSSSETEENEEKPKKPILKSSKETRRVSEGRTNFTDHETQEVDLCVDQASVGQSRGGGNLESLSALSARAESSSPERYDVVQRVKRSVDSDLSMKRRSLDSWVRFRQTVEQEQTPRPQYRASFSVAERVLNMEHFLASESVPVEMQRPRSLSPSEIKGAVPKRTKDRDRSRTQPVTIQELSDSRCWSREVGLAAMHSEEAEPPREEGAFGLTRSDSVSARASMFEAQMKKQEEESKPKRLPKASGGRRVRLDPSRFQTQPVTQDEVQEAKKVNETPKQASDIRETDTDDANDPSKLSLAERVRLFNQKMAPRSARHKTQPVTTHEVQTAQRLVPISRTASSTLVSGILKNLTEKNEGPKVKNKLKTSSESEEDVASEPSSPQKRGILKSPSQSWRNHSKKVSEESESLSLKSVLKKENIKKSVSPERKSKDLHSILKSTSDKGSSSSEDTETDSEGDKPNTNSDLIDLLHKVEAQARGERKTSPVVVPNNKKTDDKLMNLRNLDQGKENYDVTRRVRRKRDCVEGQSEGDSSSSGGREVRKIIGNEAVARRRQAGLAREAADRVRRSVGIGEGSALAKSRSHSAMNGEVEVALRPTGAVEAAPLRRCRTQPMDECDESRASTTIAQRLEALQQRGQTEWKKRISRLNPEAELPPISINAAAQVLQERLAAPIRPSLEADDTKDVSKTSLDQRLELLETSTQGWKKRVSPSDATQYTVAGRMPTVTPSPLPSPGVERKKKIPKPERFRSKEISAKDVQSMPTSPEAESSPNGAFKRSVSVPGGGDENGLSGEGEVCGPLVSVPKAFDEDFSNFFASKASGERIELRDEDLEEVTTTTTQLLGQRRTVRVQRRHGASINPVRALAARTDLRSEYVEVRTGVAQREEKRLRVEKLSKNSTLAVEALAGLASKEDFASVTLRSTAESTVHLGPMLPYKQQMLLQVKGRRHVQTRLVRPHYSSVNQGDCYVLITPDQVFHWVGEFSNVIERSRGAEIAQHVSQTRDLGCCASQVVTVKGATPHKQFWALLGADEETAASYTGAAPGHPDEDELYELALTDTNMVYEVEGDELVPRKDCWGAIPKIEILDHNKVLVFDFGSELYVWMGKAVALERRRAGLRLGQELWERGYDYTDCDVCPLSQFWSFGTDTENGTDEKKGCSRPDWALLGKITQHMETVLFREKFLDWPDFSRVIQVKERNRDKQSEGGVEVKPCDAQPMVQWTPPAPDLQLEGSHLGRGDKYYDAEMHRHYEISTMSVTVWHVQQYDSSRVEDCSMGQFHSGDTYVIRWCYSVTVTGRELSGQPSRHSTVGRDRCAYWTWQGRDASTNDKGAAALITVELDQERGPQLRVSQGQEPPAFRRLFGGGMVVHKGRHCHMSQRNERWRLYMISGDEGEEAQMEEVSCSMRQLRTRGCLLLLDLHEARGYLWRGTHAPAHIHQVALVAVDKLKRNLPEEFGLDSEEELQVEEVEEGKEPKIFFEALGGHSRQLYVSSGITQPEDSPRLFHLTSVSGVFQACAVAPVYHHPDLPTPFPYSQHDLYSARQPALFLVHAGRSLWLWQGWWGEEAGGEEEQIGEGRWQLERRAAMHTTLQYSQLSEPVTEQPLLVWAGLEPLAFTNLFPTWTDRDDIAEINIRDGRKPGEVLPVEEELERVTRSTYPPAQLLQRPLPDAVDPTRLEDYLAPQHFKEVLGVSKEEFFELPTWKQTKLKQERGLF